METFFKEIEKELVGQLQFPNEDVLHSDVTKAERKKGLERAMSSGNLEHVKVKIYFEDIREKLLVETTIWGVTDESIILKKGTTIPNHRIHKVI